MLTDYLYILECLLSKLVLIFLILIQVLFNLHITKGF